MSINSNAMQYQIHRASERGNVNFGWLNSNHSFSFGSYHNPDRMGFGKLRVVNDDVIAASTGFDTHPHDNMEIVSIPLQGALRHKDSMDNVAIIRAGEVQIMSAGTGITHSEYNDSSEDEARFLQIWVQPNVLNQAPSYQQREFDLKERDGKWQLLISPDGDQGSLRIKQNAYFSMLLSSNDSQYHYAVNDASNGVYLFLIDGSAEFEGEQLASRDAAAVYKTGKIDFALSAGSTVLVMEVAL